MPLFMLSQGAHAPGLHAGSVAAMKQAVEVRYPTGGTQTVDHLSDRLLGLSEPIDVCDGPSMLQQPAWKCGTS